VPIAEVDKRFISVDWKVKPVTIDLITVPSVLKKRVARGLKYPVGQLYCTKNFHSLSSSLSPPVAVLGKH
jgi:hypothetical protein